MEPLLFQYQVDLAMYGHDHHYERTYPVFEEGVFSVNSGNMSDAYYKPGAPIHIVAGNSGRSIYDGLEDPKPNWSAYRELSYGYTKFDVTKNSLHFKFIRNDDGSIGDEFWLYNFNVSDLMNDNSGSMKNNSLSSISLLHAIIGIGVVSVIKHKKRIIRR